MNAENFSQYIEDTSMLYQMNYEELKQLILQYPFNANLRYLLAKKSQQEDLRDFEKNLKAAAVNSPDRSHLYEMLHGSLSAVEAEPEERLELKSLQELDLQAEPVSFYQAESPTTVDLELPIESTNTDTAPVVLDDFITDTPKLSDKLFDVDTNPDVPSLADISIEEEIESATVVDDESVSANESILMEEAVLANEAVPVSETIPTEGAVPVNEIQTPILATENIQIAPQKLSKKQRKLYKKPKLFDTDRYDPRALHIVHQSVEDSEEIATETLAHLLTNQQQFEKAIEVYERLTLLFPEKSDFFAARIQEIRKQMSI
ncbi:MAG: hypothetical protein AAF847_12325 [Bacteroidota bacterium]